MLHVLLVQVKETETVLEIQIFQEYVILLLVMEDVSESIPVDPTTIPHHDLEDDQYSDSLDEPEVDGASPAELAADDDSSFGESATGWDDLY